MIEQQTLVSAKLGMYDAHAFMAVRCKSETEARKLESGSAQRLSDFIDQYIGPQNWMHVLLMTPLCPYAPEVHAVIQKHAEHDNDLKVLATLRNFLSGRKDFVFTAWFMLAENEDNQTLMKLH